MRCPVLAHRCYAICLQVRYAMPGPEITCGAVLCCAGSAKVTCHQALTPRVLVLWSRVLAQPYVTWLWHNVRAGPDTT
eukprot:2273338-Rhodomonas_salina.1